MDWTHSSATNLIVSKKVDPYLANIIGLDNDPQPLNSIEYLYRHSHLTEHFNRLKEYLGGYPSWALELVSGHTMEVVSINERLAEHQSACDELVDLLGDQNEQNILPMDCYRGEAKRIRHSFYDVSDGSYPSMKLLEQGKKPLKPKNPKAPHRISTTSGLCMDFIEMALFCQNRPYERMDTLSLLNDPFGSIIAMEMRYRGRDLDKPIQALAQRHIDQLLAIWSPLWAQFTVGDLEPAFAQPEYLLEYHRVYSNMFFAGNLAVFGRSFLLSQLMKADTAALLMKEALILTQALDDRPIELIDIPCLREPNLSITHVDCPASNYILSKVAQ
jgi:hypothetical protein